MDHCLISLSWADWADGPHLIAWSSAWTFLIKLSIIWLHTRHTCLNVSHQCCYLKQPITTFWSLTARSAPFHINTKRVTLQCHLGRCTPGFSWTIEQCRCESLEKSTGQLIIFTLWCFKIILGLFSSLE